LYLKKIEIYGFKSFADKVTIDFNSGITGIVGPNGSGKSNIIDAVRWVLGEQSAKTLRGSKMEDVIFNGTSHRKPLGLAEVSLTFDNSDNILPIDYTEVTISRRIYRSGESEYLLNKTPCRLKDIRELIMDTGIGIDGYSLIGQGEIDKILSNRPEERKQLFEEAAGIVKYKTRKEEAEKKLENTNKNLIRIEDIINEIESRIEPLKKESLKAKEYLLLSKELRELEISLLLIEIDDLKTKLESEEEQLKIVQEQIENYEEERKSFLNDIYICQESISSIENDIQNMQNNYYETSNLVKKLEGEKLLFQEKLTNIIKEYDRIASELADINTNEKSVKDKLDSLNKDKELIEDEIEINNIKLKDIECKFNETSKLLITEESKIEHSKSEVIEILNNISTLKSEINSLNTIKDNILKRIKKIEEEKLIYKDKKAQKEEEKRIYTHKISEVKKLLKTYEDTKQELITKNNTLTSILNKQKNIYQEKKDLIRDKISQLKLFEKMEKSYEGYSTSVKKTLEVCSKNLELGKGVHGVVAQLINLPKKLEIAIEVALGYSLQYVICDKDNDAKKVIKYLKDNNIGRVTFLPLSNIYNKGKEDLLQNYFKLEGYIGIASDLIEYDNKYEALFKYLLGRTLIVDTIDTALTISKELKTHKIVTLEGDVINPSGTITGGSYKSKTTNMFSRKRKIKELQKEIEGLNFNITSYEKNIEKTNNELNENIIQIDELSNKINDLNLTLLNFENSFNNLSLELESITNTNDKLHEEFLQISSEIKDINESIVLKEKDIDILNTKSSEIRHQINVESELLIKNQKGIEIIQNDITSLKVNLASLNEKRESINNEIIRLNILITELENKRSIKISQIDNLKMDKAKYIEELESIDIKLKDNDVLIRQIEYNISKLNKDKKDWENKKILHSDKYKNIDSILENLKESSHKIEMKKTRIEIQKENIIKKIWEKYELSYIEALNEKIEIEDIGEANKKLSSLKIKIKNLGDVNLNSIKEFEETNERYLFLTSQRNDLINGKASLKKIIQELENTIEQQFLKSLKEINNNFSTIFNKLFNGGKASIMLEDENKVLESNIEIIAQPPGKKLQNLSLLSGGEKALTAIALLFAILKTKPTPFCILDEIEAALDDINIYRFADFLKEFSKSSQFIIITHRKGTMEIIDYLYGITMQEYGVSKIVSVKLADVAS